MAGSEAGELEVTVDSDDEFEDSYDDPGSLGSEDVVGTVIYPLDWTVGTIVSQIDADPDDPESPGILVTDPPFQRRTAWNPARQSLFIESLMLGLPIPPLVLAESVAHPGQFYVLDGKQRLTALRRFFIDEEPLKLSGLELLDNELRGLNLAQIRASAALRKYAQALTSQPVRTIVVRNWRTPALLHLIFSRLNRAAVPLASHELRQSLFPGKFTNFVNMESGRRPGVQQARRLSEPDFRLRDAETLLRYVGVRTNRENYGGDLKQFLDRVLKGGNDHFDEIAPNLDIVASELDSAVETTFSIFGDAAFLRYDPAREKYMPRFNAAVFDAMTWHFSLPQVAEAALADPKSVKAAFETLSRTNPTFTSYLTSTTKTSEALNGRIDLWGEALSDAIGFKWNQDDIALHWLPIASKRMTAR
ncbi:DUF262 domain-containing protein [Cryobacterium sp. BB736]|uniref:DUF262 domain-containing protein n=1 Tax=Cryobacterium sp. BB736 TaxID=2746963 RepID=UPI001876B3EB|nr:DUF262 domain-containing protein [Cryobacterium sp. BB736]